MFAYSFGAIRLRKLRAALTTLGVIIGITALVALLSITQGLQITITSQLQSGLSTDTLIVVPGENVLGDSGGGFGGGLGGASSNFNLYVNSTDVINGLSPDILSSIAVIQQSGYIQNSNGNNKTVTIVGVDFAQYANFFPKTFVASNGNISLSPSNTDLVVGARVSDPQLNGTIFVNANDNVNLIWTNTTVMPFVNQSYSSLHVTAVLEKVGGGFNIGGPSDSNVYLPISQAEKLFGDKASLILVKLKNTDNATITSVSKAITDYYQGQVSVISSTAIINLLSSVFSTLQLFLGGIAGISLLVAGVGIMNIMIVSLIERTREIGILKALGMKSRTILSIFLFEAVIIGLIGALIGIASGWGLSNLAALLLSGRGTGGFSITPVLTPIVFISALGFGVGVSVIFALYPAWRASKLKPVDALRFE